MSKACQHQGISRQAHYQSCQRQAVRVQQANAVVHMVQCQRMRQPRVGTRKLQYMPL